MCSVLKQDKDGQQVCFSKMNVTDIEEVIAVEQNAYPFPWTRGNFLDSLDTGYEAWVLRDEDVSLLGYFLMIYAFE